MLRLEAKRLNSALFFHIMRRHSTRKKDTFLNLLLYLSALYEGQRPRPGRAGSYPAPILDRIKSCDLSRLFRVMSNGATLNWCELQRSEAHTYELQSIIRI